MFSRIVWVVAMAALVGGAGAAQAQVKSPKLAPTATKLAPPAEDAPAVPVLAAPKGVTVTATSNGPQVAWKAATGATSYQVLRAASATGTPVVIATVTSTTLSYVDRGFASNAVYQVVAVASAQKKATSLGVSYTRPAPR